MTTEQKALALVNAVQAERNWPISKRMHRGVYSFDEALCRAIEAHEADKKAFSDAVKHYLDQWRHSTPSREVFTCQFADFILPEPEPDPLVEALDRLGWSFDDTGPDMADDLRAALAARGYRIERIEQ